MVNVRFDGRGNSREHELPVMSDAPHERRRHLDEWGSKHVGQDQRPGSRHRFQPAACQLQAFAESVDARVLRGGAQRPVVDIDAQRSWHAHYQRTQRKHARSCPHVEHGVRSGDLHGFFQRFETQRGRWMQSRTERRGVDQPEGAGLRLAAGRDNLKASDANRAQAQDPDRSSVAPRGRRDRHIVYAERARDPFRRDAVGHQGRHPAVVRELDVNRAEFDKPIECVVADGWKV